MFLSMAEFDLPIAGLKKGRVIDPKRSESSGAKQLGCLVMRVAVNIPPGLSLIDHIPSENLTSLDSYRKKPDCSNSCEFGALTFGAVAKSLGFLHRDRGELISISQDKDGNPRQDRIRFVNGNNLGLAMAIKELKQEGIQVVFKEKEQQLVYFKRNGDKLEEIGFQPFGEDGTKIRYTGPMLTAGLENSSQLREKINSFYTGWKSLEVRSNNI